MIILDAAKYTDIARHGEDDAYCRWLGNSRACGDHVLETIQGSDLGRGEVSYGDQPDPCIPIAITSTTAKLDAVMSDALILR